MNFEIPSRDKAVLEWVSPKQGKPVRELMIKKMFPPKIAETLTHINNDLYTTEPIKSHFIYGEPGVGKTTYACQLMLEHKRQWFLSKYENPETTKEVTYAFTTTTELLEKLKSTYRKDSPISEYDVLSEYKNVDFLILDDIASENVTAHSTAILFSLVDYRYSRKKLTIYTANFSLDEISEKEMLDVRIIRRIHEECTIIKKV